MITRDSKDLLTKWPSNYFTHCYYFNCSAQNTNKQIYTISYLTSRTDKMWILLTPPAGCFCVCWLEEALDIWPDEHSSWTGVTSEALVGLDVLGARGVFMFSTLPVCATKSTVGEEAGPVVICLLVKISLSPHWREVDIWGGSKETFFLDWNWGSLEIPLDE